MGQGRDDEPSAPTLLQTAASVLAAFFGVQSRRHRERDFRHGKASHFIVMGLLATVGLVALISLVVQWVIHQAATP